MNKFITGAICLLSCALSTNTLAGLQLGSVLQTTRIENGVKYTKNYRLQRSRGINYFFINGTSVSCVEGSLFIRGSAKASATLVPNVKCKIINPDY